MENNLRGGVWVKASERLPDSTGTYFSKDNGRYKVYILSDLRNINSFSNSLYWLDESTAFDELIQQNQQLQKRNDELVADNNLYGNIAKAMMDMSEELTALRKKVPELEKQNKQLQDWVNEFRVDIEERETAIMDWQRKCSELERTITELKQSPL